MKKNLLASLIVSGLMLVVAAMLVHFGVDMINGVHDVTGMFLILAGGGCATSAWTALYEEWKRSRC